MKLSQTSKNGVYNNVVQLTWPDNCCIREMKINNHREVTTYKYLNPKIFMELKMKGQIFSFQKWNIFLD